MKRSLNKISLKNLAGLISKQLNKYDIDAVLTGGAVVSIYSNNDYLSSDLDFVSSAVEEKPALIKKALSDLGFKREKGGYFQRRDCTFVIEFIPTPLAIGSEPVKHVAVLKTKFGSIKLLSPTECVKDRLAAFYFWDDKQSLEQAKQVTLKNKIDFNEIKRWSKIEGQLIKYSIFLKHVGKLK